MRAAILTTGDEVVTGRVVDTNEAWLAEQMDRLGVKINENRAIVDDKDLIKESIRDLLEQNDLLVVTGGLGPTSDDLTAECVAEMLSCELIIHEPTKKRIHERYASRGMTVSEIALKQALYPVKSIPLENRVGMAVPFRVDKSLLLGKNKKENIEPEGSVFFLPGVPIEMMDIAEQELIPWINEFIAKEKKSHTEILLIEFFLFGLPESLIVDRLKESNLLNSGVRFAINFKEGVADIRLFANRTANLHAFTNFSRENIRHQLEQIYHGNILPEGQKNLALMLHEFLSEKNKTISLAESCTGGGLSHKLTSIPGSSKYLINGLVTYSNESKMRLLGVKPETIEQFGAVSRECVQEMLYGCLAQGDTDYAIAISGIAGPDGGTKEKPVGTVFIGVAERNVNGNPRIKIKDFLLPGNRDMVRLYAAQTAIFQLLKLLKII